MSKKTIQQENVVISCKVTRNLQSELDKISSILHHESRSVTIRKIVNEYITNFNRE